MSTTVNYKGDTIATLSNETKTLTTAGSWLEDDIEIVDIPNGVVITDTTDSHGGTIRTITSQNTLKLQGSKTVIPSSSAQTISPDTGYDGFAQVTVGGSKETELLDGTISGKYTNNNITRTKSNVMSGCLLLEEIDFPSVTSLGGSTFSGCYSLKKINAPLLTTFDGNGVFYNCRNLIEVDFPLLTSNITHECFRAATALIHADIGSSSDIKTNGITSKMIDDLIIRKTDAVTTLSVSSGYSTNKVGHIYVPKTLISSYQQATNWSEKYSEQPDLFRGLEDYTTDGTTTGAFNKTLAHTTYAPVYTLENQEFNGTSDYIDTGIKLYDDDGVFTIIISFSTTGDWGNPGSRPLLHCFDETQTLGFKMNNNGNSTTSFYYYFYPNSSGVGQLMNPSANNTRAFYAYFRSTGLELSNALLLPDGTFTAYNNTKTLTGTVENISNNLIVGAKYNNGYSLFWKGTVHSLKVYKKALTSHQIYKEMGIIE